jgi:lauroyl/myristoyl acyltransferase
MAATRANRNAGDRLRRFRSVAVLNILLFTALRVASRLLEAVPASTMYRLARAAGTCAFYLVPGARAGVTANLAIVLNRSPSSREVRSTAKRAFQHDAMNWIDTLRIGRLSLEEIRGMVRVDDWLLLESYAKSDRGLILVTLHLGNFDLVGQVLVAHGYRLTVPVEQMHPRVLFDFLVQQRTKNGISLVPVEHASRELIRALRSGEMVGLAGDRNLAGKASTVPVFGKPAALPLGPVALARHTASELLVAVGVRVSPGQFRGIVRPVPLTYTGNGATDDANNLAAFARLMEEIIAEFPEQWLAFTPFWKTEGDGNTATMGHQKRAAV